MPLSYRIDPSRRCVFVALEGHVTGEEIVNGLRLLWADPAHSGRLARLIDARGVTRADVTAADVQAIADEWRERLLGRTALLADSDAPYGLFRMYEVYACDVGCEVFRDYNEALRWLGVESKPSR